MASIFDDSEVAQPKIHGDSTVHDQVTVLRVRLDSFIEGRVKHDELVDRKLGAIESNLGRILEKQGESKTQIDTLIEARLSQSNSQNKERFVSVESDVRQLQDKAKPNWALVITGLGVAFTVVAGIAAGAVAWVHSDITTMVQPIGGEIATIKTIQSQQMNDSVLLHDQLNKSSSADEQSRTDRANLNSKSERNIIAISELDKSLASLRADVEAWEREVETQIDATGQSLGIQFAEQSRKNNTFASALAGLGAKFPMPLTDPYVIPNISNRLHPK